MYSLILAERCLGSHEINMLLRSVYILVMNQLQKSQSVLGTLITSPIGLNIQKFN